MSKSKDFTIKESWEDWGITEHAGGIPATRRLFELCGIEDGQSILYLGCGTAYTVCLLAKEYDVSVVASDISAKVLAHAEKRISKEDVGDRVTLLQADAEDLRIPDNTFDVVLAESTLAFCDPNRVASEAYRVLKPSGVFGVNEVTYLKDPPAQLRTLISSILGPTFSPSLEGEWRAVFTGAGFGEVSSEVGGMGHLEDLISHLKVDGVRKMSKMFLKVMFNPRIARAFINKDMLTGIFKGYTAYIGYGLYVGRKGQESDQKD